MRQFRLRAFYRAATLLLSLSFILACGAQKADAEETEAEKTVLRVAFVQTPGLMQTAADGSRRGVVVDYLNEIAKYTGWEYEYMDIDSESCWQAFTEGRFDLLGGCYYLPELTEHCFYPNYSCGFTKSQLLARRDDEAIRSLEARYLNGKTIGVYADTEENVRRLKDFLAMNGISCNIKPYASEELVDGEMYAYLESGEVDLLLENDVGRHSNFRVVATFDAQPHYIVTTPGNHKVLDGLNMAMEKILDANPSFAEERYDANFPNLNQSDVFLTAEERNYIQQAGQVTVALPERFHPLICLNESDTLHNGLVPDILQEVTNFSGLLFTYIYTDSYSSALELVQQGQADMAGFFLDDEDIALEMGLSLTTSYATLNNIIVRNKFVSYPGQGLSCAVLDGRKLPSDVYADHVKHYANLQEALSAVNRGECDFVYGMSARMEMQIQNSYLPNIVPLTLFNDSGDVYFALAKPAPAQLLTILNKAIYQLGDEEKDAIVSRNLISIGSSRFSLKDLVYSNPVLVITVTCVFVFLVMFTILAIARFRMRAAVMRSNLERSQAESKAKGEFLSHMSHEIRTPMNAVVGLADLTSMMEGVPEKVQRNLCQIRASSHYLLGLINDILDMSRIDKGRFSLAKDPFSLKEMLEELENMMGAEAKNQQLTLSTQIHIQHDVLTGDVIRLRQVLTNLLSNAIKFTMPGGHVLLTVTETDIAADSATFSFHVIDDGVSISPEDQKRIFDVFEQAGSNQSKSMGTGLGLSISNSIVSLMGGRLQLKSGLEKSNDFYFDINFPFGILPREEPATSTSLLKDVRLLLAEDNALNAEIAVELLKLQGAEVTVVENGRQAVEKFSASYPGEIQAIVMDVKMPVMDGLEATRVIRRINRPDASSIPIIAMTANSFQEDIDAAEEAGMNGFVTKPMDRQRPLPNAV